MYKKKKNSNFDLEERTLEFGKKIITICQKLPKNIINQKLIAQIIRSGTSPGSNYREANESDTKKDFKYKIGLCRKESKETSYWLKLLIHANPSFTKDLEEILIESIELRKIFSAIAMKSK